MITVIAVLCSLAAPASCREQTVTISDFANEQLRIVQQGHGRSGVNRDYVLATVKAIEAEGFRDAPLHQLAMMLHDAHPHEVGARTAL
jgi:cation transport regulator ChaC